MASSDLQNQGRAIAAVGECTGAFDPSLPAGGGVIVLPPGDLDREDLACLIQSLAPVVPDVDIRREGVRPSQEDAPSGWGARLASAAPGSMARSVARRDLKLASSRPVSWARVTKLTLAGSIFLLPRYIS